jgi:S-DNA-T family DNA segregation ATPase FtsK/SpoIIIE
MTVPPWPGEHHACSTCGTGFVTITVDDVVRGLPAVAAAVGTLVHNAPARSRAAGQGGTWSAVEYLCHLRDVLVSSTIRLYRARTEDQPVVEPMFNDLRAARFRYAERDPVATLDELDAAVAGCLDEIARVTDWDRTVARRPGEVRTARWLARNALHEGRHHLLDIDRLVRPLR